jgi:positive regulator of sigma E activity
MILNHIQRKVSDVEIKEEPLLKTALISYIDPRIVLRWCKDNAIESKIIISI